MRQDLAQVIEASDTIVLGSSDRHVQRELARRTRPDQVIIDLVGVPAEISFNGRTIGLCW
jgi:GDP-mannose 6-dehydrogenase